MKKFYTVVLMLLIVACSALPSPNLPPENPPLTHQVTQLTPTDAFTSLPTIPPITSTPAFTPSPDATQAAQLQQALVVPTLQPGRAAELLSIQMIDAQFGWAIHEEAREVLRPGFQGSPYLALWPREGYILRTQDGGKTWQDVTPPTGAYSPGGFFALDENTAWASNNLPCCIPVTETRVWRTTDGGKTWQASQPFSILESGGELYLPARMQFVDRNSGWLLAGAGALKEETDYSPPGVVLFRTTDGGDTWERINESHEDLETCEPGALAFSDATTGWYGSSCIGFHKSFMSLRTFLAQGGLQVRQTIDAGDTFSAHTVIPAPPDLQERAAANPSIECGETRVVAFTSEIVGIEWKCLNFDEETMYRYFSLSTDTGQTWKTWDTTGNEYFFNAMYGWRVLPPGPLQRDTDPGQLQQTMDGGANWVTIKPVAWPRKRVYYFTDRMPQFDFVSEEEGWAIAWSGDNAALVHTTDGGKAWEEIKPVIDDR